MSGDIKDNLTGQSDVNNTQQAEQSQEQVKESQKQLPEDNELLKKMQELSMKEKELEPLIQFQEYLKNNPEKAQKIAQILSDDSTTQEQKNDSVSELLDDGDLTKKEINELKKTIKKLEEQIVNHQKEQIKEKELEFLKSKVSQYEKEYGEYFDKFEFKSAMLAYPESYLDSLPDDKYEKLLDETAKSVCERRKNLEQQIIKKYIEAKKDVSDKTKSETNTAPQSKVDKQIKVSLDDDSAKKTAIDFLKGLLNK